MAKWSFQHWQDGDVNVQKVLAINAPVTLTAYYAQGFQLGVNSNLSVSFQINGTAVETPFLQTLLTGNYVIVMPTSVGTYRFKQWNDGDTNPTKTVNLTADISLFATYEPPSVTFPLSITSTPSAINFTINGNPATTPFNQNLAQGTYTIAMPATIPGEHFKQWNDGDTNPTKTINLAAATSLNAIYEATPPVTYALLITSDPSNVAFTINTIPATTPSVQELPTGSYTITMPGTLPGNYVFKQWNDGDTSRIKTISLTATTSLSATYEIVLPPPAKAIVAIAVEGHGTTIPVPGIHITEFDIGSTLNVTAVPSLGWQYLKMKRNGVDYTVSNPGVFTNLGTTEDIDVVFQAISGPETQFPWKSLERFPRLYQIVYNIWARFRGKT